MKYQNGVYQVKTKGRGVCLAKLTTSQAKALFEILESGQLEIESINFIHN